MCQSIGLWSEPSTPIPGPPGIPGTPAPIIEYFVRNCVLTNIANLAAFTVAGNDGITNVENDIVLLINQTVLQEDGPYLVGPVVAGVATLTRVSWWADGTVLHFLTPTITVMEGTIFAHTEWQAMSDKLDIAGENTTFTVGTDIPAMYPKTYWQNIDLNQGVAILDPAWFTTKSSVIVQRIAKDDVSIAYGAALLVDISSPPDGITITSYNADTSQAATDTGRLLVTIHNNLWFLTA
jgi:hypothetical protein